MRYMEGDDNVGGDDNGHDGEDGKYRPPPPPPAHIVVVVTTKPSLINWKTVLSVDIESAFMCHASMSTNPFASPSPRTDTTQLSVASNTNNNSFLPRFRVKHLSKQF